MANSRSRFLLTSESVSAGHPDKICDRISDSVVDAVLAIDPVARTGGFSWENLGLVSDLKGRVR